MSGEELHPKHQLLESLRRTRAFLLELGGSLGDKLADDCRRNEEKGGEIPENDGNGLPTKEEILEMRYGFLSEEGGCKSPRMKMKLYTLIDDAVRWAEGNLLYVMLDMGGKESFFIIDAVPIFREYLGGEGGRLAYGPTLFINARLQYFGSPPKEAGNHFYLGFQPQRGEREKLEALIHQIFKRIWRAE